MIDVAPVNPPRLPLFGGFGVELEYMIVRDDTLDVLPIADRLLQAQAGEIVEEIEVGPLAWSNELVLHVVELKTNGPAASLSGLATQFQQHVICINELLKPFGGRLLPGAMHPWMHPDRETRLWPHGYNEIYAAYDRIFSCQGHGWSNLQSTHINLPFASDEEFARLHAAIRLLLPILPAIAASSPMKDGAVTGFLDTRLEVYRTNQRKIPSIAGLVVPEAVWSQASYESDLLARLYADIAPHDPDGILQFEWLNSRGAIARFDRNAIEIRTLDIQECPAADIAIVTAVVSVLQALVSERWSSLVEQQSMDTDTLAAIWRQAVKTADETGIDNADYLRHFGITSPSVSLTDLWRRLLAECWPATADPALARARDAILGSGPLARRLLKALGGSPTRSRVETVWRDLADCLADGRLFLPDR